MNKPHTVHNFLINILFLDTLSNLTLTFKLFVQPPQICTLFVLTGAYIRNETDDISHLPLPEPK